MFQRLLRVLRGPPQLLTETLNVAGEITLKVDLAQHSHLDPFMATGKTVWPATAVLASYLAAPEQRSRLLGRNVIEVGSGMGLVGMAASALGAQAVCLTDRRIPLPPQVNLYADCLFSEADEVSTHPGSDHLIRALRRNVAENMHAITSLSCRIAPSQMPVKIAVEELAFGDRMQLDSLLKSHGPFQIVLGSDVTYFRPILPELVATLRQLADASRQAASPEPNSAKDAGSNDVTDGGGIIAWLAHARRQSSGEAALFSALEAANFETKIVHEHTGDHGHIVIVECRG
eukprot:TRINITY_DN48401_c0_g1_i1.p1 TRINITY_DN48401_c0_g1~~TRINITY_DN48401_c0_g1_i1.p1  ORF type:complete len:288 (-),score=33.81 TRINITY_DN48401_c0_g1_i1:152-1015(-)